MKKIRKILEKGGVIIFPTETVYGLGVDPFNREAVKKIYKIKKRDRKKPLTLHIGESLDIYRFAHVDRRAKLFIENFLPGPLTIILPKLRNVPRWVVAGRTKVGFRFPSCQAAQEIIKFSKTPIAATSVNISGQPPITDIKEIEKRFGHLVDYIIKEPCNLSRTASTVVDLTKKPFKILREGEITAEELEATLRKGGIKV